MLNKIAISDWGEIVVRIIRGCSELGIRSIAVYSVAQQNALHVNKAYYLRDEPVIDYENPQLSAMMQNITNRDFLHPGYDFLSSFGVSVKETII